MKTRRSFPVKGIENPRCRFVDGRSALSVFLHFGVVVSILAAVIALLPVCAGADEFEPQPPGCLEPVGRWARGAEGWTSTETVTNGSYIYFGSGALIVAQVDENGQPRIEAELAVPGWNVAQVALAEGYLVVLDYQINDIQRAVRVIDISDPLRPSQVGFFAPPVFSRDLAAAGDLALVVTELGGLQILDLSDPTKPKQVGSFAPPTPARSITTDGVYAYLGCAGVLRIIDAHIPSDPIEIGSLAVRSPSDMCLIGDLLYLTAGDSGDTGSLCIVDVNDPRAPANIACLALPQRASAVSVEGDVAVVATQRGYLRIVDVGEPSAPTVIGTYDSDSAIEEVTMTADQAWISGSFGMRVVDVSSPAEPVVLERAINTWLYTDQVAVYGDLAFLSGSIETRGARMRGMWTVDARTPLASREAAFFETPDFIDEIDVSGNYAYLAVGGFGLRVIDVADPADPHEVGFLETTGDVRRVAIADSIAFIGDQEGRLLAVDVNDPSAPHPISLFETSGPVGEFEVDGPYLYLAQGYEGLRIIDYSDPFAPTEVGYMIADTPFWRITIDGHYAYVTSWSDLRVIDISDPQNPLETSMVSPSWRGSAMSVKATNDRVFILLSDPSTWGGYEYGLAAFDLRDPTQPVEIVNLSIGTNGGSNIAVANGFVYLPRSRSGLDILANCEPPPPRLPDGRPGW